MHRQNEEQKNFIKNLLSVAPKHCDNCGAKYSETDFKVIKNGPASTVLHLKCTTCDNAYMLNVLSPMNGMVGAQRTPVNIDLEQGDEIQKFAGKETVDRNEAIDIHNLLKPELDSEEIKKLLQ